MAENYTKAKSEHDANFDQASASADGQEKFTENDEINIEKVWKALVKLFHPDQFHSEPEKQATYEKLTSVINQARDNADIKILEEIAEDPEGYIERQGWTTLDFGDEADMKKKRKLYEALQLRIIEILDDLNILHDSPDWELKVLSAKNSNLLTEIAGDQIKVLEAEISALEEEALKLQEEIDEIADENTAKAFCI